MSDDDRAERLRERRNRTKEKRPEADEQSEASKPSEQSETDEAAESDETDDESESVKDTRTGTYMYLPEEQSSELSYQFKRLSAEYERETGEEFEKNRHFYPLVISHGLDSLEQWDGSDVKDAIESSDGL